MEREYVVAGIGLLGLAIGSFLTGFWGYRKARTEGITNLTMEEIKDRTHFYKMLMDRYNDMEGILGDMRIELAECKKELEECRQDRNVLHERMRFLENKTITYKKDDIDG